MLFLILLHIIIKTLLLLMMAALTTACLRLATLPIYYTRHIINRGKGSAVRTGMKIAQQLNAQCIVTIDGDGQHSIEDIKKLTDKIESGYDVALGVRSFDRKQMPLAKVLANHFANIIIWLLFGIKVKDSQSGFKAYSRKALEFIQTSFDSYEHESEILSKIRQHKLTFAEVPIKTIYTEYSQTKLRRQNIANGLKVIYRMIFFN
jgi:glycosyltransferase involved in cell wall biosynthesis